MERFRKLQIVGLERTYHGQSMSYAISILVPLNQCLHPNIKPKFSTFYGK